MRIPTAAPASPGWAQSHRRTALGATLVPFLLACSALAAQTVRLPAPAALAPLLPQVHLTLWEDTLDAMQGCLRTGDPAKGHEDDGDKPYFKALVADGDATPQKCFVCLRGLMPWHHTPQKPSLRVKLKKADWSGGDRYIELSRPEDTLAVKNWLPLQLAADLGLITDQTEHVELFINRKSFGVYLRSGRPSESLALANGRMPGTFFKGDFGDLWQSTKAWDIAGEGTAEDVAVFEGFLRTLRQAPTPAVLDQLQHTLDGESYARWAALMIVTGSLHTDYVHNQVYFFSANEGKLHIVPWDCNSFGIHSIPQTPVDTVLDPVMAMMLCDPRWVHRRNQWIQRLLDTTASPARMTERVDASLERTRSALAADATAGDIQWDGKAWQFLARRDSLEAARDDLRRWIEQRTEFLRRYLADARVVAVAGSEPANSTRLYVVGSTTLRWQTKATPAETSAAPQLLFPGLSAQLSGFHNGPSDDAIAVLQAIAAPMTYTLPIPLQDLALFDAISGRPMLAPVGSAPSPLPLRTLPPSAFPVVRTGDVILGPGAIDVVADIVVGPQQRLLIRAGTTLRLAKGVGIYAEGPTTCDGTEAAPVHLQPLGDQPWAAFSIAGEASAGSVLTHFHATGGSLGNLRLRRFKGMVNVYNCPSVALRHCEFSHNHGSDDTVNLAQSTITVEDCRWHHAAADALDLDMCRGSVLRCEFDGSGNDGLDLMASDVEVESCTMTGSGDKGISVGEDTRLVVKDSRFLRCNIGTELKDNSRALFERCSFTGNRIAVHAYQKKQIYPRGGIGCLVDCQVSDSRQADVVLDANTALTLVRSKVASTQGETDAITSAPSVPDAWREVLRRAR